MATSPIFDATIDLLAQHLDAMGIPESRSAEALEAVRASVTSMPGAGWVDVGPTRVVSHRASWRPLATAG